MQLVLEFRDNTKIATAAADGPEQVGILFRADFPDPAVRGYDLGAHQVIDRQAEFAIQPAETTTQGKAADARV